MSEINWVTARAGTQASPDTVFPGAGNGGATPRRPSLPTHAQMRGDSVPHVVCAEGSPARGPVLADQSFPPFAG